MEFSPIKLKDLYLFVEFFELCFLKMNYYSASNINKLPLFIDYITFFSGVVVEVDRGAEPVAAPHKESRRRPTELENLSPAGGTASTSGPGAGWSPPSGEPHGTRTQVQNHTNT